MSDLREGLDRPSAGRADRAALLDEQGRLRLRRRRRGRTSRRAALAAVVVLLLLTAVAVYQLASARSELRAARVELSSGAGALPAGRPEAALESFDVARRAARAAERRLSGPVLRLVGGVPGAGNAVRTSRAVAAAAAQVAEAGQELAGAAVALPEGVAALAPQDGRIPVRQIAAVAPALERAHGLVAGAQHDIAHAPTSWLPRTVADARDDIATQLAVVEPQLEVAAALTRHLPAFLGADGPRRYFFAAQNPAELRGTGGFIGAYTILEIDDGELRFGSFQSIVDLSPLPVGGVEPPSAEYRELYGWAGGAGFGQSANMTPDVPSAALALQRLYERIHGQELDGAVFADPHAFAGLLRVAGSVEVPDIGEVSAETVVAQVANEAYALLPDSHARKELLGEVASATLARFLSEGARRNPMRAAEALIGVAAGGHLRVAVDDPDVMGALDTAGVTGRLAAPHGLLAVVGNNAAQNKVDFYTDRHIVHEVWLEDDGRAVAETTVLLTNEAPTTGLPLDVIGPNADNMRAGENRTFVTVFCGASCTLRGSWRDNEPVEPLLTGRELGNALVGTRERFASGEQAEVTHRFRVYDAWDPDSGVYRLRVLDQPTIRPTTAQVIVHSPEGLLVRDASAGVAVSNRTATWSGELTGSRDIEARFGPPARSAWQRLMAFLREPAVTIGG